MENYEGDDVKKGKPKWLLWAIIGVVVVAIVVMVTQLGGGESPSASGLTLDDLSAIVNQQSTSVQGLTQWKATTTEDLANLNTKQQQILSQLSGITNPKDWTSDMNKLKVDFTALQESWDSVEQTIEDAVAGINMTLPRYAMVSGMEEKYTGIYIDVSVYGAGDYPVLVSLFGGNLQNAGISIKPNSGCSIQDIYRYGEYGLSYYSTSVNSTDCNCTIPMRSYTLSSNVTQVVIVIMPKNSWDVVDLIQLKAVGNATISYAMATVGDSWAEAAEEW